MFVDRPELNDRPNPFAELLKTLPPTPTLEDDMEGWVNKAGELIRQREADMESGKWYEGATIMGRDAKPKPLKPLTAPIESIYSQAGRIPHDEIRRRSQAVLKMGLPSASRLANKYHGKLIIAGGGPSLAETLPDARRQLRTSKATKLLSVNRTHDWLLKKGLKPDFGVLIDPKPWVANYMTPTRGVKYLHGAKVDQAVWDRFKNHPDVYHWHPLELSDEKGLISHAKEWLAIPGQSTVGLRSVPLGYVLGFRRFELHGLDCNKRGINGHAYQKFTPDEIKKFNPESDLGSETFFIKSEAYGTRYYLGTTHMARQCGEFVNLLKEIDALIKRGEWEPVEIRVAGISAMGYLAALKGLHVNDSYNQDPSTMPTDWTIEEPPMMENPLGSLAVDFMKPGEAA